MGHLTRRHLLAGGVLGAAGGVTLLAAREPEPRFLALGDSYTVGTAVATEDRWVNGLAETLRDEGVELSGPEVVAQDGWTTDDLSHAVEERSLGSGHALVTLLVGANDAFLGFPVEQFRPKFVDLLERSVGVATDATSVVALTIPDYTHTPVGQQHPVEEHRARLERYNDAIRTEVGATDARLVDLVPPSRAVADRPELVADDGLHPSPAQHDLWLERVLPAARAALS